MSHDPDLVYRSRMGFSWYEGARPAKKIRVSLGVLELAGRLEEVARELHMAYQNSETRIDNIVVALHLLDILQAEIE